VKDAATSTTTSPQGSPHQVYIYIPNTQLTDEKSSNLYYNLTSGFTSPGIPIPNTQLTDEKSSNLYYNLTLRFTSPGTPTQYLYS